MPPAQDNDFRLLRLKDVMRLVGLSRSTIYVRLAAGKFPAPVYPAPNLPRWRSDTLQEWIDGLSERQAA